jgi:NADPH:quinone reductase-like Zn-dependent oxidoreductase
VLWWNTAPNGKSAAFYDLWGGSRLRKGPFRARTRKDLTAVLELLAAGVLTAQIAARLPLSEVRAAMELAESHTAYGKVVLVP